MEPLLRGHPDERPPPLERQLDNVNLNINVLIFTPDERPPLLKDHFSDAKGVASQEGFHCMYDYCTKRFDKTVIRPIYRFIYMLVMSLLVLIGSYSIILNHFPHHVAKF